MPWWRQEAFVKNYRKTMQLVKKVQYFLKEDIHFHNLLLLSLNFSYLFLLGYNFEPSLLLRAKISSLH